MHKRIIRITNQSTNQSHTSAAVAHVHGLIKELLPSFKFAQANQTTFYRGDVRRDASRDPSNHQTGK